MAPVDVDPEEALSDPAAFWRRFRGRSVVIETAYAQTPVLREGGGRGEAGTRSGTSLDAVVTSWRRLRGTLEAVTTAPPGLLLHNAVEEVVIREVAPGTDPRAGEGVSQETNRLPRKFVAFGIVETVDFPEETDS